MFDGIHVSGTVSIIRVMTAMRHSSYDVTCCILVITTILNDINDVTCGLPQMKT